MGFRRRSIRLPAYDYSSAGAYFVTICAHGRRCLFGEVEGGEMRLNEIGESVATNLKMSEKIRKEIVLDEWIVMPNHLHAIVWIVGAHGGAPIGMSPGCVGAHGNAPIVMPPYRVGTHGGAPIVRIGAECTPDGRAHCHAPLRRTPHSIASFVAGFKRVSTMDVRRISDASNTHVWQRGYYEHVIRNELELDEIRRYIAENPQKWELDKENPQTSCRRSGV